MCGSYDRVEVMHAKRLQRVLTPFSPRAAHGGLWRAKMLYPANK